MIRRLEVKGLNNRLDKEFEFNEDLNIFTGANGSGKTTLLKLIWYLISGNIEQILSEIPFSSLSIQTNQLTLSINQFPPNIFHIDHVLREITDYTVIEIDPEDRTIGPDGVYNLKQLKQQIARTTKDSIFFPTFRRIEGGFSIDSRSSLHAEDEAVLRLLSSTNERLLTAISQLSEEMSNDSHKFIYTVSTMDIIQYLPDKYLEINLEINNLQSQVLEKISREIQSNPKKDKVGEIPKNTTALLDAIKQVDNETEQLRKPFSVLSELTRKILRYNTIRVTENLFLGETTDDITYREGSDDIATEDINDAISSDKLSSGEKQMLSFLCYNAFSKNTPIFIDEPELSLHVDWQRILFPTLLEQATSNQFFIATHSPFIYTKYPDKEFMLDEDRGES